MHKDVTDNARQYRRYFLPQEEKVSKKIDVKIRITKLIQIKNLNNFLFYSPC